MSEITVRPEPGAIGGAIEGAERMGRETALWRPSMGSPDQAINRDKPEVDARARDLSVNDGWTRGAVDIHRDSIVGSYFRLNAKPDHEIIGADESWAEEFQRVVEKRFRLSAESEDKWLDASRVLTFTGMVRLGVAMSVKAGEITATAEWIRERDRPFSTAIQMFSPDRLSNPDNRADDRYLRRGKVIDDRGKPIGAWICNMHPMEFYYNGTVREWKYVPWSKPWGRKQVLHVYEPEDPGQSRGLSAMVSVLKKIRMLKRFNEIALQNAVVNASYAATIESELPSDVLAASMGGASDPASAMTAFLAQYLGSLNSYLSEARNISIDGVKIPHLFPGTKLNARSLGAPGGVGDKFEESMLRHIAAGLGVSYEELARDYSKVTYSSARTSIMNTGRTMAARKKTFADAFATQVYTLWLEEQINAREVPMPRGMGPDAFYRPLMREAFSACSWIGSGRGQIDEMKETEAAVARITAGLSTLEIECARLGYDYRDMLVQRSREVKEAKTFGLVLSVDAPATAKESADAAAKAAAEKDDAEDEDGGDATDKEPKE